MIKPAVLLMIALVSSVVSIVAVSSSFVSSPAGPSSTMNPSIGSTTSTGSTSETSSTAQSSASLLTTASSATVTSNTILTTATATSSLPNGSLTAQISIGSTQPVCFVNATKTPAPPYYSSIGVVITDSSGGTVTFPVDWVSNGCNVTGSVETSLRPGSYSLNLSSCPFLGCKEALPKSFTIYVGQTTEVDVSIFTGIV